MTISSKSTSRPSKAMHSLRRSEVALVLAQASAMATGQSPEFTLQSCVLARRLGQMAGATQVELEATFFHALLRFIGCNADTRIMAGLLGDEIAFRKSFAKIDATKPGDVLPLVFKAVMAASADQSGLSRFAAVISGFAASRSTSESVLQAHCEVAAQLGSRLGLSEEVCRNLTHLYVRWDGKGLPAGIRGNQISLPVQLVVLAQDVLVLRDAYGDVEAMRLITERRGKAYDPALVYVFISSGQRLLRDLARVTWQDIVAMAPAHDELSESEAENAVLAVADFADLKLPFAPGHSRQLAALVTSAAVKLRRTPEAVKDLRWAALLHDLGNAAVPYPILGKSGPYTQADWELVRLHPYHGERITARVPAFARAARLIGQHHERLNGNGYHSGLRAATLDIDARLLAAAEAYQNHIENRPHRKKFEPQAAAQSLLRDVDLGLLDRACVSAVLAAAGQHQASLKSIDRDDLTAREQQVLGCVAQALTMKEMASQLGMSPKTVDNHLQSIYAKLGVKTRAGAALVAVERGFLSAITQ